MERERREFHQRFVQYLVEHREEIQQDMLQRQRLRSNELLAEELYARYNPLVDSDTDETTDADVVHSFHKEGQNFFPELLPEPWTPRSRGVHKIDLETEPKTISNLSELEIMNEIQ